VENGAEEDTIKTKRGVSTTPN